MEIGGEKRNKDHQHQQHHGGELHGGLRFDSTRIRKELKINTIIKSKLANTKKVFSDGRDK